MSSAILGGGLSGLATAHYLLKKVSLKAITIIESSPRTGGWIRSTKRENGLIFEQGPRTIRPKGLSGHNTLQLVEELGLADQIVSITSSHPAAKNRMIYAKGKLHLLPSSLMGLFKKQEPFSKPLILHLMKDLRTPVKLSIDESIYDFINRRFGTEVADYLISPLICGICAGNAKEVSVNFLMRKLFILEQEFGSISRGLFHTFLLNGEKIKYQGLGLKAKREKWNIYSFKNGCETLPLALKKEVESQGVNIRVNTTCEAISFKEKKAQIHFKENKTLVVDNIFSSIPAPTLAKLLGSEHPELASLLKELTKIVSVAVVNLHFEKALLREEGFGVLVAPKEELPVLGIIYDSCIFPKAPGSTTLTVMMGGFWFEQQFGANPDEKTILDNALNQVKRILKISEKPADFKVNILHQCIPQYTVGHNWTLKDINNYIKSHNLPISLCGTPYYGIGINDVILSAKKAVDSL